MRQTINIRGREPRSLRMPAPAYAGEPYPPP
jgi:hypothetical protein